MYDTQSAGSACPNTTIVTMTTVIVNAIDTQRWICRTHLFQRNGTSSEGGQKQVAFDV